MGGGSIFLNKFLLFAKVWETCGQALTFCKGRVDNNSPKDILLQGCSQQRQDGAAHCVSVFLI